MIKKFREHGWRTRESLFSSPVHVAMVHQMPSFEIMSSCTQRKPLAHKCSSNWHS